MSCDIKEFKNIPEVRYEFPVSKWAIISSPQRFSQRAYEAIENPLFDEDLLAISYRQSTRYIKSEYMPHEANDEISFEENLHFMLHITIDLLHIFPQILIRNEFLAKQA